MSKLGAATIAGMMGSCGIVGGAYLMGAFNSAGEVEFKSLSAFKEANGEKCTSKLFGAERKELKTNVTTTNGTVDDSFFGAASSDREKGCLVVDWQKDDYKDSKWEGIFTITWSFINDSKGMILFLLAKTGEESKLKLEGGAYLFSKEDSNGTQKWKLNNRKEIDSNKTIEANDFETHFPKVGTKLTQPSQMDKNYWGFVSGKDDIAKACMKDSCVEKGKRSHFRKEWNWEGKSSGETGKLTEWSADANWLDKIFADWKLKEKLEKFTGVWK